MNFSLNSKRNVSYFWYFSFFAFLTFNVSAIAAEGENGQTKSQEREKVITFVEKAKNYIETHGKEKAMIEFNKKSGEFSKDSSYIFAVEHNGIYLATINYPNLVGENQLKMKDPLHVFYVTEEIEKSKSGGGWIDARLKKNPYTGKKECKDSYLLPMPGDYFIGSGYYYPPEKDGTCNKKT